MVKSRFAVHKLFVLFKNKRPSDLLVMNYQTPANKLVIALQCDKSVTEVDKCFEEAFVLGK